MRFTSPLILFGCIALCACSATGLDAQKTFSCKAPAGIGCASLSGVYANAVVDNLPGSATAKPTNVYNKPVQQGVIGVAPSNGTPLLSTPTVLRVWVSPWEDSQKVLHDQAFLYAVADPGHWQIAHSKKKIADQYRVFAPAAKQEQTPASKTGQAQYEIPPTAPQQAAPQGQN